jgi:hypothetical protein
VPLEEMTLVVTLVLVLVVVVVDPSGLTVVDICVAGLGIWS